MQHDARPTERLASPYLKSRRNKPTNAGSILEVRLMSACHCPLCSGRRVPKPSPRTNGQGCRAHKCDGADKSYNGHDLRTLIEVIGPSGPMLGVSVASGNDTQIELPQPNCVRVAGQFSPWPPHAAASICREADRLELHRAVDPGRSLQRSCVDVMRPLKLSENSWASRQTACASGSGCFSPTRSHGCENRDPLREEAAPGPD